MAVICHNCRSADTITLGGVLLACQQCGHHLDQNGNAPVEDAGDFPVTWTGDPA